MSRGGKAEPVRWTDPLSQQAVIYDSGVFPDLILSHVSFLPNVEEMRAKLRANTDPFWVKSKDHFVCAMTRCRFRNRLPSSDRGFIDSTPSMLRRISSVINSPLRWRSFEKRWWMLHKDECHEETRTSVVERILTLRVWQPEACGVQWSTLSCDHPASHKKQSTPRPSE